MATIPSGLTVVCKSVSDICPKVSAGICLTGASMNFCEGLGKFSKYYSLLNKKGLALLESGAKVFNQCFLHLDVVAVVSDPFANLSKIKFSKIHRSLVRFSRYYFSVNSYLLWLSMPFRFSRCSWIDECF